MQSELISILLSAEEELLSKISPGNCSLFCWVSSQKPLISSLTVSYIYPVSPIDPTPASPSLSPWTSLHAPLSPSCSYFLLYSTESTQCFLLEPRWLPLSEHCAGNSSCSNSISGRATSYLQTVLHNSRADLPALILFLLLFCDIPWPPRRGLVQLSHEG